MSVQKPDPRAAVDEMVDEFSRLPAVFAMRGDDGFVEHVEEPAWNLLADGFYGQGVEATLYQEGEIIISSMIPNFHMQPLNRAAGKIMRAWLEALPMQGTTINIDDLSEAATALAGNEKLSEMTPEQIKATTYKLALALKVKRENTAGMVIPPMAGATIESMRNRGASKAPMMNARMLDQNRRFAGEDVRRGASQQRRAQPAALTNPPPASRG